MQTQTEQSHSNAINRRQFIGSAAAGTLALTGITNKTAAQSDALKVGVIGCGWYGMVDMNAAFKAGGVECVALCDVDSRHLKQSADEVEEKQGTRPKTFKDYREFLEVPELDAVIIATPPQWHALNFLAALEKGLDIYCEKPLSYDIREGQAMVETAQNSDSIVQIGFQRRQSKAIRQAREYIQSGKIGKVVQVDAQIHYAAPERDTTQQEPPESLDWDFWCGPAPKLPYSPSIAHKAWRLEKEYGNGHLVDWGIHWIDAIRWILDDTMPTSVISAGNIYQLKDQITTPDTLTTHFEFETCPVVWRHRLWGAKEYPGEPTNGMFFYGEKATLFVNDWKWEVMPNKKRAELETHKATGDEATDHMADFLSAVKTRQQPSSLPEDAFYSSATTQLGMISWDAETRVDWNMQSKEITNSSDAAKQLKREYREPWVRPFKG